MMSSNQELKDYWINILLLAIAIFFFNLWLKQHIPDSATPMTIVNSLIAIYAIGSSVISKGFGEQGENRIKAGIRWSVLVLLRPGFIVLIYLVFIVTASVYSSVSLASNNAEKYSYQLFPLDRVSTGSTSKQLDKGIHKQGFFTSPFGRTSRG